MITELLNIPLLFFLNGCNQDINEGPAEEEIIEAGATELVDPSSLVSNRELPLVDISGEKELKHNIVEKGDEVSVIYTGKLENGEGFDSNIDRDPLKFIVGQGMVIKGFDNGVIGMKINDKKELTLPPSEAYGDFNPKAIFKVARKDFPSDLELTVGLQLSNPNGEFAVITEISGQEVTLDANHPLAGKTVIYDIEVVSLTKAVDITLPIIESPKPS